MVSTVYESALGRGALSTLIETDISDRAAGNRMFKAVLDYVGIDIVINNAASAGRHVRPLHGC